MTVHKLTAGDGYTYLSRQVAAHDATSPGADGLAAYYTAKGEAPGRWLGSGLDGLAGLSPGATVTEEQLQSLFGQGRHPDRMRIERDQAEAGATPSAIDRSSRLGAPYRVLNAASEFSRRCAVAFREANDDRGESRAAPLPAEVRAAIRTDLAVEMFREEFGREPLDARELSGHLARISRQTTTAVAGYDLSFSPVKSVSTLWAIAPREVAAVIEQAHDDAVRDVVGWLESRATFTRTGRGAVAQVDVRGLIAAAFTHRDSRAGDPDLHTHVAISNKVETLDGRWLALDGRPIFKNAVAASERFNTRLEALLVERLGVRFAERPDVDPGKRAVREVVGVDGPLPRLWSSRRAAIDTRRAELSARFQADHGRPPTTREAIHLAQQANLETRQAKHEPRSHAEQRDTWRAEALTVLGGTEQLDDYVARALSPAGHQRRPTLTDGWIDDVARSTVDRVALTRATWDETHLRAEAERRARRAGVTSADVDRAVDDVVTRALSPQLSVRLTPDRDEGEPAALRRRDGSSVFEVVGSAVHTSTEVLDAEQTVMDAAGRFDGHVTPVAVVEEALRSASSSGPPLNSGQADFVRALATSGARLQVAVAPAGTGKTTALRALAEAWRASGGDVVGLAPSAAASSVLRHQLAHSTDTLAKFVHASRTGVDVPDWMTALGPRTLVVVDEAGAAATPDLAEVVRTVVATGGSVRLVGDDQQLGAIGAGGLLSDVARSHGAAHLTEVVRFTHADSGAPNTVEGVVSLALREGDPSALAYYADRGRLQVGDLDQCVDQAYRAWSADRDAGRDPLMLAPTRELVRGLNVRARNDRLTREGAATRQVLLADGTTASTGDVVISRRNDRTLASGTTTWVTNGDRWTVAAVRASGALDVVHTETASLVTLPSDYVRAHVTLGYATTVHGSQGVTAGASYTVVNGTESRQQLYVALTRGRHANHAFVSVTGNGDPHSAITRDGVLPPTAIEILERVLERDDAPLTATAVAARETDPVWQLPAEADRYVHALMTAAEHTVGAEGLTAIDRAAEAAVPGLTDEAAYPTLRAKLSLLLAAGHDPTAALQQAVHRTELASALDPAAVLDWRIGTPIPDDDPPPLRWLPALPRTLAADPTWGAYLAHRSARVRDLALHVVKAAAGWTPESAPRWARALIDDVDLVHEVAVWRAARGVDDADPRPTGAVCRTSDEAAEQRRLDDRVRQVVSSATTDAVRWAGRLRGLTGDITADPFWPTLLERLSSSRMGDPDGAAVLAEATAAPLPDELPAAALWWRLLEHLPMDVDEVHPPPVPPGTNRGVRGPNVEDSGEQDPPTTRAPSPDAPASDQLPQQAPREPADIEQAPSDQDVQCGLSREEVLELNRRAANFYRAEYPGSWSQAYLVERLGSDPTLTTSAVVGHAPRGWTNLVDHLRLAGNTDDDLVAAGLATRTSSGRVVDRFRDRVVFAIQDDDGIVGWIGRRHPDGDRDADPRVPKYLNTPTTAAFVKGEHLFGLADGRALLDGGAMPVLVEGPLDALATTIAGGGRFLGVAPLGTAFTAHQAARMRPLLDVNQPRVIVGMDADPAGLRSAEKIFELLSPVVETRALVVPEGQDPAGLRRVAGDHELLAALTAHVGLASLLAAARIDEYAGQLDTPEGQVTAARRSAELVSKLPVAQWPALMTQVVTQTGLAPDILLDLTLDAADRGGVMGNRSTAKPQDAARPRRDFRPAGQQVPARLGLAQPGPLPNSARPASRAPAR